MINLVEKYLLLQSTSIFRNLTYLIANVYLYCVYNMSLLIILILISFFCFFFREKRVIWDIYRGFLDPYNDIEYAICSHHRYDYRGFFFL